MMHYRQLQMNAHTFETVCQYYVGLLAQHEVFEALDLMELMSVYEELFQEYVPIDCSRNEALYYAQVALECFNPYVDKESRIFQAL